MEAEGGQIVSDRPADGVLRLTLDHPARRNALDGPMLTELARRVEQATERAIVIRGAGPLFSAGYDLHDLPGPQFAARAEALIAHPHHRVFDVLEQSPATIIAELRGAALGGALELAICCDLRLAADDLTVGMPAGAIGLTYSHTGVRRFMETIGLAATKELFLLGRRLDATRAHALGIVTAVSSTAALEHDVIDAATQVTALAPHAVAANKRIIEALRAAGRTLDPAVERELQALHRRCFGDGELAEGVDAFVQRREPRWEP
jgi:enoyl-CoA hydratase/carnithine racemase